MLLLLLTACLPDPQRMQSERLLDQLVSARAALANQQLDNACNSVGDVQSKLFGEPGLVDVRPAWPALRDATQSLLAACGQARLLAEPYEATAAILAARTRWQAGVTAELTESCRDLNNAAQALGRPQPC